MTHQKVSLCSHPWCRDDTLPGEVQCAKHYSLTETMARVDRKPQYGTERRYDYDLSCMACGRSRTDTDGSFRRTEAEAARLKPERCAACGGRMLLTRADIGHLGSSFDPSTPTRATYRVART